MKEKVQASHTRKAHTRTLIQIGGIVEKSSLLSIFGIQLGEDLQSDLNELGKAATLLGFLISARDSLPEISESLRDNFKNIGEKALRYNLFTHG